jgi:predicted phage-related endonuclease
MEVVNLIQGSQEWLDFRKEHYPASEAPVVMGAGKFEPKTPENLALVRLGVKTIDVSDFQQSIFDKGHHTEECARPLVEKMLGEPLSNMTGKIPADELNYDLSASLDGINFDGDILFEHKMWNESLASDVRNKDLKPFYYWQLEQQLLVSNAKKVIFVTSDAFVIKEDELEQIKDSIVQLSEPFQNDEGEMLYYAATNFEYMEYEAVKGRSEQLIAGWKEYEQIVAEILVDDDSWNTLAEKYIAINQQIEDFNLEKRKLQAQLKPYKTALIGAVKATGNKKVVGGGLEVAYSSRKGSLDEKKLLELLTPEQLETCRKSKSTAWRVKVTKLELDQEQIKASREKSGSISSVNVTIPVESVVLAGTYNF